jgi:hypothetical protein
MGSSTKRRQTMMKLTRERKLKERRAQKQEKRDERKQAAAAARNADAADSTPKSDGDGDETPDHALRLGSESSGVEPPVRVPDGQPQ